MRRQKDRTVSLNLATDAATSLLNVWIRDAEGDTPTIEGRPAFVIADAQVGSMGARVVQWMGQLSKSNGTEVSAAIVGGEIYTYDWGTDTLTASVEAADLATASVTLSATARVYACEFADTLVFNDGTNQAFTWDGTAGDTGLTPLTNAPAVAYGAPWVRAAKLFFIVNATRNTITWSEEGTANTGYSAGGYTNAWDVRQTSSEGFVAGRGTNDGLYLFRPNSVTMVFGDITPNFSTTADDEAITEHVGCRSPSGVFNMDGVLYFLSNDRRFLRLKGQSIEDVGEGSRTRLAALNPAKFDKAFVTLWDVREQGERVMLAIPSTASDDCDQVVVVNPVTGLCEGTWSGWKMTAFGRWKDANGEWRLVHGGGGTATSVDEGYLFIHGQPDSSTADDELASASVPVAHQVETSNLGGDTDQELTWTGATAIFPQATELSGVQVSVTTPRGATTLTTPLESTSEGGGFVLGVGVLGTDTLSEPAGEERIPFGLRGVSGRWARFRFAHATLGEKFSLQEVVASGVLTERRPTVR